MLSVVSDGRSAIVEVSSFSFKPVASWLAFLGVDYFPSRVGDDSGVLISN